MHDTTLLQLIEDDIAPTQELLELLQKEAVALHGRDIQVLENILARKQSLIVLLEQQGMRRNQLLVGLGLSADRAGVQALAAQSSLGEVMLQQLDVLTQLMDACQRSTRPTAGSSSCSNTPRPIRSESSWVAIPRRSMTAAAPPRPWLRPAPSAKCDYFYQGTEHTGKMPLLACVVLPGD